MPYRPRTHRPPGAPTKQEQQRRYDERRGDARQFYGTSHWRKFRDMVLRARPLCECKDAACCPAGCNRPASQVHHVLPRKDRPDLTFDEANVAPLCAGCHSRVTRKGGRLG